MKITLSHEETAPVSGGRVGLALEDVNCALDGGLYAEMLENRNFEAKKLVLGEGIGAEEDGLYAWAPVGEAECKIKTDRPLFPENPHYLRLRAPAGGGVKNAAYGGISLKKGEKCELSFYARAYDYKGKAEAGISAGGAFLGKKFRIKADGKWRKYGFRLRAGSDLKGGEFLFRLLSGGTVHLDAFSLMPESAIKRLFRRDLAEELKDMKAGFLRFPCGCGEDRVYPWKDSLGERDRRRTSPNFRGAGGDDAAAHSGSTFGLGLFEFFLLAEYSGAQPLPVVGLGSACPASRDREGAVQEALDLIDFALGEHTEWGRAREEMGRAEPFPLEYLGVDCGKNGGELYDMFASFSEEIHARYPGIKLIPLTGARPPLEGEGLMKLMRGAYAVGERLHAEPGYLFSHADVYGGYPQGARVYLELESEGNWRGALAEAAFLTGAERHPGVAVMASCATLLERKGRGFSGRGLFRFDGDSAEESASCFVWQLFSLYTGNLAVKTAAEEGVFASATERDRLTYLKLVNAGDFPLEAEICGDYDFGSLTRIIRMEGEGEESGVAPYEIAPSAPRSLTLPPRSFSVLVFRK